MLTRSSLFWGTLIFLTMAFTWSGAKKYPLNYFRSPVNSTVRLSGTFGELRPNHLHSGIDIKAVNGKIGQPLFAAASGHVSRVKVQSGGYGNVLYISHPNGYTTVYAHLHRFPEAIRKYVKDEQYKRKKFEVDLYPPMDKFNFEKGEKIGSLGLSGRSFGPHLHFEIRDTHTEKPINPLLFGLKVVDDVAPRLHKLKVYHLNDRRETIKSQVFDLKKGSRQYYISGDTLNIGAWRIGLGLKAFDHFKGVSNWNGIYRLSMHQDDQPVYDFTMETFAFNESRFINAHVDYEEQIKNKSYYNRLFTLPGNRLSIYGEKVNKGIITLHKGKPSKITMIAEDVEGNTSKLEFWIRRTEVKPAEDKAYNYLFPYDEENLVDNGSLYLHMPKGTLYENLYLQYHTSDDQSSEVYSSVHHIHNFGTPVHRYFELRIRPTTLPEKLYDKAFLAYCNKKGEMLNCGGTWESGYLKAKVRQLGDYCIMVDETAPTITPVAFQKYMKGANRMSFKVKDNIETTGRAKGFTYEATVDGKWILMEYDAKKDILVHHFDGRISAGEHLLKLSVSDSRGNQKVFEKTFFR